MEQGWSGVIMSLDNVFAVFLLPVFGNLSDKVRTKIGKRSPFILGGTILACVFFILMGYSTTLVAFIACLLLTLLSMATFRSPAVALMPDVTMFFVKHGDSKPEKKASVLENLDVDD